MGLTGSPFRLAFSTQLRGASADETLPGDRIEPRHLFGWTLEHQRQGERQRYRAVELTWLGVCVGGADYEQFHR